MSQQATTDRFPDAELRAYLLADFSLDMLAPGESDLVERIESALMESPGALLEKRLRRAASGLIDEYAWDELSHEERRRFLNNFLRAPERRRELSFALRFATDLEQELAARAGRRPVDQRAAALQEPGRVLVFRRPAWMASPGWSAALAAALIVAIVGGVWSFAGKLRLEERLDEALSVQAALAESEEALRERAGADAEQHRSVTEELEAEQLRTASLEREIEALREGGQGLSEQAAAAVAIASVWLTPGMTRGGDELERVIVPADAPLVRLRLDLGIDDSESYRVALLDSEGDELWMQTKLDGTELDARAAVEVTLPASLLKVGDYSIRLSGADVAGEVEHLGSYSFRVLLD
jgi:negative regulator of sigma E activity